jgi:hypothetical protein
MVEFDYRPNNLSGRLTITKATTKTITVIHSDKLLD